VNGIATHDHGRVLRVGQESYRSRIGNGVDAAQLDVDLEADVREVLGLGLLAFVALQALSCYSGLITIVSQGEETWAMVVAYLNVTEAVGGVEAQCKVEGGTALTFLPRYRCRMPLLVTRRPKGGELASSFG